MQSKTKRTINNMIYAFLSQGLSLGLSFVMSLIVPKMLGITEYGYWQLFLFYVGYVGFFHFGFCDGIYLKLGGKEFDELDKSSLSCQNRILLVTQTLFALVIVLFGVLFIKGIERQFVIIFTAAFLIVNNIATYLGFIFQAVNDTKTFSKSIMIDKLIFLACVIGLLFFRIKKFEIFIILYFIAKLVSLIYLIIKGRKLIFCKANQINIALKEFVDNIKIGIFLMIANIASSLILGISRFIIDSKWGIEAFGKFSFSLSLIGFALVFISQISMVLFPALRQSNSDEQSKFYRIARNLLGYILPFAFICYFPAKLLLNWWLPQYNESIIYLALLLPNCTFDGKMQMLCSTYFKVLRKEKHLLLFNGIAMGISVVLSVISAYVFDSILLIIISVVIAIAIRSIISEIYLAKLMKSNVTVALIQEVILVIIFMLSAWYLDTLLAFIINIVAYILYIIINIKNIKLTIKMFKKPIEKIEEGQK